MRKTKKLSLLILISSLLSFFCVYLWVGSLSASKATSIPDLETMLPNAIPGWSVEELPVGETEEVKRRMGSILNYDAAIVREYSKGLTKVQVYLSYWTPGKAHFRLVYGHTPDVCWVNGGWSLDVRDPAYKFQLDGDPALTLKTAQYREFVIGSERLRVMFWQLLDGEPFTYGNYGEPPATAIFTDILSRGFHQKPEQWFIRISANRDFESIRNDPGFRELMYSMRQFGLGSGPPAGPQ